MADIGPGPVLAQAPPNETARRRLLCPFMLQLWAVDRMLNFEIGNNPHYAGLELQVFDDPAHGQGGWPCWSGGERVGGSTFTGNPA